MQAPRTRSHSVLGEDAILGIKCGSSSVQDMCLKLWITSSSPCFYCVANAWCKLFYEERTEKCSWSLSLPPSVSHTATASSGPSHRSHGHFMRVTAPLSSRAAGPPQVCIKKPTSHNTHKILMCLQNYLIFYLEVIPPLSSFIALYMTEVGERHQMRPSRLLSRGSVYGLTWARREGPWSPFISAPPPLPAARTCYLETAASPPGPISYCSSKHILLGF